MVIVRDFFALIVAVLLWDRTYPYFIILEKIRSNLCEIIEVGYSHSQIVLPTIDSYCLDRNVDIF